MQVYIVLAYCVLHNFIKDVDPDDILLQANIPSRMKILYMRDLPHQANNGMHKYNGDKLREKITDDMWCDYISQGHITR